MKICAVTWLSVLVLGLPAVAAESKDIVLADFEGETYGDWTTTGSAFGEGPATEGGDSREWRFISRFLS